MLRNAPTNSIVFDLEACEDFTDDKNKTALVTFSFSGSVNTVVNGVLVLDIVLFVHTLLQIFVNFLFTCYFRIKIYQKKKWDIKDVKKFLKFLRSLL